MDDDPRQRFLQRVRDGRVQCPEVVERSETCVLEANDGLQLWRCTETVRRFRECLSG